MKILIVGSLAGEIGQAARIAVAHGARLDQVEGSRQALTRLRIDPGLDVVLCDIAHDIAEIVKALAAERINVPVIACGTGSDPELATRAIRDGAREFLPLPPDPELIAAILEAASGDNHTMVAHDPAMSAAVRRAAQVASSEASVLISGESGTGKEVLARYIHRRSRRAGKPFVALNCAAIPENLLESELFGHEKGAFSGAIARRVGKFEAAESGTLLLDEISEMDIRLQAKLLRVLQEREVDRLGGHGSSQSQCPGACHDEPRPGCRSRTWPLPGGFVFSAECSHPSHSILYGNGRAISSPWLNILRADTLT